MNKSNYVLFGAGLGLITGYFLNSDSGRTKRKEISNYLANQNDQLKEKGSELLDEATQLVSSLKDKGNKYLADLNKEIVEPKDIEDFIEKKVADFRKSLKQDLMSRAKTNGKKVKV